MSDTFEERSNLDVLNIGLLKARVAELEAENKRLRRCADAMADAWEKKTVPIGYRAPEVAAYNAAFPREEAKS